MRIPAGARLAQVRGHREERREPHADRPQPHEGGVAAHQHRQAEDGRGSRDDQRRHQHAERRGHRVDEEQPDGFASGQILVANADAIQRQTQEIGDLTQNASVALTKVEEAYTKVLSAIVKDHKQVLFEGNGYSEAWHTEAEKRGLPNNKTTVDALPALTTKTAKELFSSFGVSLPRPK